MGLLKNKHQTSSTSLIFGLPIYRHRWLDLKQQLKEHLQAANSPHSTWLIATPNPEQIVLAETNANFKAWLAQCNWLLPDGIGLVWASRWRQWCRQSKFSLKERITGVDLVTWLLTQATRNKYRVLVVGGQDYDAAKLRIGRQKFVFRPISSIRPKTTQSASSQPDSQPAKKIIDWTPAYQNKHQPTTIEEQALVKLINSLRPQIVLVALGAPEQEKWLIEHRSLLEKTGVSIAISIGGALDMLTGRIKRAPIWWQRLGLEWFWRLLMEPWRWRRQMKLLTFIKMSLSN